MTNIARHDLAKTTLSVFFIVLMAAASFWILRPFLPAMIWATMIVVATWPLMLKAQEKLGGRRKLAVVVMTLPMLLVFVVPFSLAIGTIVENVGAIRDWVQSLEDFTMPPAPDWLEGVPLVGASLEQGWQQIAAAGPEELSARLAPAARKLVGWFVAEAGGFGLMLVHFLLTLVLSAILYSHGEKAAEGMRRFARRMAGIRGEHSVTLAAQAIRAVALGVIVTALVQSILAWLGLAVAGMPYATLLTAIIFILCIAQLGPTLVMIAAVIWLYLTDHPGWGTALLVWSVLVGSLDNFLRPMLIKRGANLPLLLIFAGVIGGLIAFGIIGLFIGPVVLSVTYTLLAAWVKDEELELPLGH